LNFEYAWTFVQNTTGGTLLNNYTGYRGMQITVDRPTTVTGLARRFQTGNTQTHTVKLVLASTGADVPGGSVTWDPSGMTTEGIAFVPLASPVTLAANTTYYVVSSEINGGDQWYSGVDTTITHTAAATVPGTVYGNGSWTVGGTADHCNGSVSFMYTSPQP
jgi:hypothetical protein